MARSHLNADINFKVRNVTAYRRKNSTVTDVKTLLQSSAMFMSTFFSTYEIYTDTTWYEKNYGTTPMLYFALWARKKDLLTQIPEHTWEHIVPVPMYG
jgi:hypothetical protein